MWNKFLFWISFRKRKKWHRQANMRLLLHENIFDFSTEEQKQKCEESAFAQMHLEYKAYWLSEPDKMYANILASMLFGQVEMLAVSVKAFRNYYDEPPSSFRETINNS